MEHSERAEKLAAQLSEAIAMAAEIGEALDVEVEIVATAGGKLARRVIVHKKQIDTAGKSYAQLSC